MARSNRTHFGLGDNMSSAGLVPKHLTKQEFGRRLYKLMLEQGWNQSELARRSKLPRDSISVYINGKSLPTAASLQKLANALGKEPVDLLPNAAESAIRDDIPPMSLNVSGGDPTKSWLTVNRLVSTAVAVKILDLLNADVLNGA